MNILSDSILVEFKSSRDNQHLNPDEYKQLYVSFEKGMQRLLPLRPKKEADLELWEVQLR
ncbi:MULTISPECIES: hypothetical protein [Trichocoleus]|uniref:Uncharacterized protein n=1 Tax=Trichocoleus desertorum GB2-A4 TaxID=2933944 RepID=A0ABV0JEC9_9CYAN|nr:hypothetical protein [Trichocoleus sp. FACHB-46]MBD1865197.1 hypothetical protein [Trichocoleus sp. FACHB-46]